MKERLKNIFCMAVFIIVGCTFISAEITNTPPSAVITYPHSNAYYQEGSNIVIRVYSTDFGGTFPNGTVENVEFFVDDEKIYETSVHQDHTYTYIWEDVQAGEYRITARATDNDGDSFTSAGVILKVGEAPVIKKGISAGKGKYLGNVMGSSSVRADYLQLWNGVTAENAHKWGSIEGERDVMNWTTGDNIYNFAADNNLVFRYHAIAWGSQYPTWLEDLEPEEFQAEIEEYMAEMAARYPYMDQIDVLNENLYLNTYNGREHAAGTPYFRAGLGGPGETGYDWVIWLFEKAREYFPNSKLVMNDFELENNPDGINEMLDVVKVLRDRGLIDGFGTQAHTFNVDGFWNNPGLLRQRIDMMASSGVPVYVTELDLIGAPEASEANQLRSYQNIFPVYWEHPAVAGITLWGYVEGATWWTGSGIINADGTKRDALIWLEQYMRDQPDVGFPFDGEDMVNEENMVYNGEFNLGTSGWNVQNNAGASSSMEVVNDAGMSGYYALRICPDNAGTASWHIQIRQQTPILNGHSYTITFMAKADEIRNIDVAVQQDGQSFNTHFQQQVNLTTEPQEFTVSFTSSVADPIAALKFYLGGNSACVYIDNVSMMDVTDSSTSLPNMMNKEGNINVYPNPFSDKLFVDVADTSGSSYYEILNINGQVLVEGLINSHKTISTELLTAGIYFLRIMGGNELEIIKLIKN
ncbi:hypothetical protein CDL62_16845 [Alkalitalea saponilacus]|nr:hypothetical protein CDL62_16845 [Alkalitalea saponilacus]